MFTYNDFTILFTMGYLIVIFFDYQIVSNDCQTNIKLFQTIVKLNQIVSNDCQTMICCENFLNKNLKFATKNSNVKILTI